jgi:colanic acid biosynthesis glycosyl transferase WcaI
MRVLIVSQYFWPENFRINDLASDLVKKGHQVTVLTGVPNYPEGRVFDGFRNDPEAFSVLDGVAIVRVPLMPRGAGGSRLILNYLSYALMASIFGAWKLRGRAFDVIFVNQLSPVTVGIPGALMARIKNAPMVMWVLDLWPDTLQAIGVVSSPRLLGWVRSLTKFIYNRCDVVLVQSRSFIPVIKKIAPARLPIEYFPSWAEDVFQQRIFEPALEIPKREDCFDVMFAGNIGEAQDFPCVLAAAEALKEHQHIRWLIIGDGRLRVWVEQEIRRRGLENRVLLLGRFPLERMPSFYQRAHVLLVALQDRPIFNMTIPGKLQSYLAAARPIVAALNGEGAELLRESGAGYVSAAGNHVGLAEAILRMSGLSDAQRRSMGENGRAFSDREFQRERILRKLEETLKKTVSGYQIERSSVSTR